MLQMDLHAQSTRSRRIRPLKQRGFFSIVGPDSSDRAYLETRVRSGFGTHFGACIEGFMPRFALYKTVLGSSGVIGIRGADEDRLFLERYLGRPVEDIISGASGIDVSREQIAEVGQFVTDDREIVAAFFRDLVPFLKASGYDWVCFTGTRRIRAILDRVGFHGLPIAEADKSRVADDSSDWGNYYDHQPVVIVGKLDDPQGRWCALPAEDCLQQAVGA